jgi:hypothetical protein
VLYIGIASTPTAPSVFFAGLEDGAGLSPRGQFFRDRVRRHDERRRVPPDHLDSGRIEASDHRECP